MINKYGPIAIILLTGVCRVAHGAQGPNDDEAAVAATVKEFEESMQTFDLAKANSVLAPGARWIENSLPGPANDWSWWESARAAGIRVSTRVHDLTVTVDGNVAWVTLIIDATFHADTMEGQKLLAAGVANGDAAPSNDPSEQAGTYVESEVLIRTTAGWKIALGHTSRLGKPVPPG